MNDQQDVASYLPSKLVFKKKKGLISPFFVAFALLGLWNLFSYPFHLIFPNDLYTVVLRTLPVSEIFEQTAYLATIITFVLLVGAYSYGPASRWTQEFQERNIYIPIDKRLFTHWLLLTFVILGCCATMYIQADYSFPLLIAGTMNLHDYNVFRKEVTAAVSPTLINFLLYFLHPYQIILTFSIIKRNRILLRVCTILLVGLTSLFLLARSSITIPIIVSAMAFLAYRPVRARAMIMPTLVSILLGISMMAYSTKDLSTLSDDFMTRVIHGQWVGLPLYFWYFQDNSAPLALSVHPALRPLFGIADEDTPGRELMRFVLPTAAESGGAGNIPTYFIGESYAFGGWWLVILSTLHVSLVIILFSWSFTQIPKTIFTCTLFGLICYKIGNGLTSGISAFYISGTTGLLLGCLSWALLFRAAQSKTL